MYQVKLVVFGAQVWRRVLVRGEMSLRSFNHVICRALGWEVDNQYTLGVQRPWNGARVSIVERWEVRVRDVLGVEDALCLGYEYGHGWQVYALVENVGAMGGGPSYPVCIAGCGSCRARPEDRQAYWTLQQELTFLEAAGHQATRLAWIRGLRSEAGEPLDLGPVNAVLRRGRYPALPAPAKRRGSRAAAWRR